MYKNRKILLLLVPALSLYLVLFLLPAVQAIFVSLYKWNGFTSDMEYIGLDNYRELLVDSLYGETLLTTLKMMIFGGVAIFILAFLFTFILTSGIRGKKIFRTIIFYPNVVAPIALATFWGFIYNPRFGLVNGFLRKIGLESLIRVWTGPDLVFWAVLVAIIWTYVGLYLVILLSATKKIPLTYYDAAKIEGANKLQTYIKVTIPLIWDAIVVSVVLWIITAIKLFEFLFAFSGGTRVPRGIWTNAVYMFMLTFGKRTSIFRFGYGSAVAVSLVIFIVFFTAVARIIMKREKVEF